MFNRIHLYNNYLIHVIYFVLYSAVEPMTTLSWQLCKQACYQVGYGWTPLSQRRQEAWLILFYKIIIGLAQVPFEDVLVEAYKGTRRKHNMKFRQIGHATSQYGQAVFSLKLLVHFFLYEC